MPFSVRVSASNCYLKMFRISADSSGIKYRRSGVLKNRLGITRPKGFEQLQAMQMGLRP